MGSRIPSHQLSNGLVVSGLPEQHKERQQVTTLKAMPYTGGDLKKSGELGKMFDIPVVSDSPSRSNRSSNSGPQLVAKKSSGQLSGGVRSNSGALLQPTGLITSGPLSSSRRNSGQLDAPLGSVSHKVVVGPEVTNLRDGFPVRLKVSKVLCLVGVVLILVVLGVACFVMARMKNSVMLNAVVCVIGLVVALMVWNWSRRKYGFWKFALKYPDAELRGAVDGQFVKITGVVTCGSLPLESSYQMVPRCVYVSTGLYEYRGWGAKAANPKHCWFSWGLRHLERHVVDFYISDFQSGLRAMVKAGYNAKVHAHVKPSSVVDVTKDNRELSPGFIQWLSERKLSADDRRMRIEEGYIKEGSTVSVMGILRRQENVLMIVPPAEAISTGFQMTKCFLPTTIKGLIITCDDSSNDNVITV